MRDSYERFFSEGYISKEQFFDFGIRETIYAPLNAAKVGWEKLKQRIKNNQPVYMRGFGRNSKGSHLFQELYKDILGNENVKIDPTGNHEPATVIRDMTGYSKVKSSKHELIRNYQVSHIFGRTKNIFTFTAPWNIVYLPKIIDPFTGHEAKGDMVDEYRVMFQQKSYAYFEPLIEDYNALISDDAFQQSVDAYFKNISNSNRYPQADIDKLIKSVREELTPISVQRALTLTPQNVTERLVEKTEGIDMEQEENQQSKEATFDDFNESGNKMPVIRISDALYKKLEALAIGFDTPQNVIERLVEKTEGIGMGQEENQQSKETTFDGFNQNGNKMPGKKITLDIIKQIYPLAIAVFEQKDDINNAQYTLVKDAGMNPASARMYLDAVQGMMKGEPYIRTINALATEYFLKMISSDFGQQALKKALSSVAEHIEYYEETTKVTLYKIRAILQKFSEQV